MSRTTLQTILLYLPVLIALAAMPARAAAPTDLEFATVRVTPVSVRPGGRVAVIFVVRNVSGETARTQGPRPGTVYTQRQNWQSRGYAARAGRFRLGLTVAGPRGQRYPFRWGLGSDLPPGGTRRVVGYLRLTQPGYYNFLPAIILEGVGVNEGRSVGLVQVGRPSGPRTVGAQIVVNGQGVPYDVPPKIANATILVPLRFVGEALGGTVSWDRRRRTATIAGNGRTVTARIGDPIVRAGTETLTAYTPPRIIRGRTMVPLRIVAYALGASVDWDERTKTVSIQTAGAPRAVAAPEGEGALSRRPGARIIVNGREIPSDVPPRVIRNTILVPLRFVGEALGATVNWDAASQTARIVGGGRTVTARVGWPALQEGRRELNTTVAPRVIQGRIMVPLRALAYALGATVDWDGRTRTVSLQTPGAETAADARTAEP